MEGLDRAMIERCLTRDFGQAVRGAVAVHSHAHRMSAQHARGIARLDRPTRFGGHGINAYALRAADAASERLLGSTLIICQPRGAASIALDDLDVPPRIAACSLGARARAGKRRVTASEQCRR